MHVTRPTSHEVHPLVTWDVQRGTLAQLTKEAGDQSCAVGACHEQVLEICRRNAVERLDEVKNCFEFVQGASGDVYVTTKVAVSHAASPFGEVQRDAVGSTAPLGAQGKPLLRRQCADCLTRQESEALGFLPRPQLPKIAHATRMAICTSDGGILFVRGAPDCCEPPWREATHATCDVRRLHSHSIVAGGFELTSYVTRFTPFTSLITRLEIRASTSGGNGNQSAVMPSRLVTARSATT